MFAPTELYNDGKHICISFSDLVAEAGEAVQANQFLVVDNGDDALIDPGGNMTYHALYMTMSRYVPPKKLRYVCASHADPDIIASLARWIGGNLVARVEMATAPKAETGVPDRATTDDDVDPAYLPGGGSPPRDPAVAGSPRVAALLRDLIHVLPQKACVSLRTFRKNI